MNSRRPIPGYIYDDSKRRYFKIERGTIHSQENVNKKQKQDRKRAGEEDGFRRPTLKFDTKCATLGLETGTFLRSTPELQGRIWCRRLKRQASFNFDTGSPLRQIQDFGVSCNSRIYVGTRDGVLSKLSRANTVLQLHRFSSEVTSVSLNDQAVM